MNQIKVALDKNHGFTLIELMIVIAIIGMLATVALPSFEKYMEQTRKTEGFIGVGNIAQSQKIYFAENQQFITEGVANPIVLSALLADGYWQIRDDGDWKTQAPFALGSRIHFVFQAYAGSYDSSGTLADGFSTSTALMKLTSDGASCFTLNYATGSTDVTAQFFGAPAAPANKYDYVLITAWSSLKRNNTFSNSFFGQSCFYLTQMIESQNGSLDFNETPLIQFKIK